MGAFMPPLEVKQALLSNLTLAPVGPDGTLMLGRTGEKGREASPMAGYDVAWHDMTWRGMA